MEVIITHANADFDAFGAQIAASKIYKGAIILRSQSLAAGVDEFYNLYKHFFKTAKLSDIDISKVTRAIIVDTHTADRLRQFRDILAIPDIDIHIYDHHPLEQDRIHGSYEVMRDYGSTCTIFALHFKRHKIALTPEEATLMTLGIYMDTGSLSYLTTKPEDAEAVAYLLEQGANLKTVGFFMLPAFNDDQRGIYYSLLPELNPINIKGFRVVLLTKFLDQYIKGLAFVIRKLSEVERIDAIFGLFHTIDNNRTYIIGRSRSAAIDINAILAPFGGGGHEGAGSAVVKYRDLQRLKYRLVEHISESLSIPNTVREIMSQPVHTASLDESCLEAYRKMRDHNVSGLIVCEYQTPIGLISIDDIDKAQRNNLMHAPVKSFMRKDLIKIDADTSLTKAQEVLIENNVGRLAIVNGDVLCGIVTRTDIRRYIASEIV